MDKIICDLCGTSYPDTAAQCPICGTARTEQTDPQPAEAHPEAYAHVRGGRFSKSNVRKRTGAQVEPCHKPAEKQPVKEELPEEEGGSNKGLIIVVVILLLAIIGMVAYVAIKFIDLTQNGGFTTTSPSQSSQGSQFQIPCTGVTVDTKELTFAALNETALLQVTRQPADTTDELLFLSSNDNIVKVDDDGLVTPIANGEAIITISCGKFTTQCKVVCQVGVAPPVTNPDPTEPIDPPVTNPSERFSLNRMDLSLSGYGATWDLTRNSEDPYFPGVNYAGPSDPSLIAWSSEDPAIATVENGVVTAVGNGTTYIAASYNGKTVQCIVRCSHVEPPEEDSEVLYQLNYTDVTMDPGDVLTIRLHDKATGASILEVTYRMEDETICTVDENGRITAQENTSGAVQHTVLYVDYEGQTFSCIIRVRKSES